MMIASELYYSLGSAHCWEVTKAAGDRPMLRGDLWFVFERRAAPIGSS